MFTALFCSYFYCRDNNIKEKKEGYKLATGEEFPDFESIKKKKKPNIRTQKVSVVTNIRKSLRNVNKVVNYKELP